MKGDGRTDDTKAIQSAIDAPNSNTVYLPGGFDFHIDGRIEIRGGIKRFIGLEGRVSGHGTISVVDGAAETVIIERLDNRQARSLDRVSIIQASSSTLVLSSLSGFRFDSFASVESPASDVFISDVALGSPLKLSNAKQRVFARQLNIEEHGVSLINDGADLFVLGYKTESESIKSQTDQGGRTELIGAHILSNSGWDQADAMFQVNDSHASFVGIRNIENFVRTDDPYEILVSETRDGVTQEFTRSTNSGRGAFGHFSATDGSSYAKDQGSR